MDYELAFHVADSVKRAQAPNTFTSGWSKCADKFSEKNGRLEAYSATVFREKWPPAAWSSDAAILMISRSLLFSLPIKASA